MRRSITISLSLIQVNDTPPLRRYEGSSESSFTMKQSFKQIGSEEWEMETQNLVRHADDGTYETLVLGADKPVLVDFWAPWCGPCRAIAPVLEELASDYAGRLEVVKVNVDESPGTASRYGVRSIPTLHLLKGGKILGSQVGLAKKADLATLIDAHL